MPINKIHDLDISWINSIEVNDSEIKTKVATASFTSKNNIAEKSNEDWLKKSLTCVDLSLLVGNETPASIEKLCQQAAFPLKNQNLQVQLAAVCVYPSRVRDAVSAIKSLGVNNTVLVASVAAGFPTGQFPLHTRIAEIYYAVAMGADEIDVVIDRSLVLRGHWAELYNELVQMRAACGEATLKVILSVTECGSLTNVYKASVVAMLAGADFIKTSTGKEATTMSMHEGLVMCQAIREFYKKTGVKVGLKPAGGIRTAEQAISWLIMIQQELGDEWLDPKLFRIGTSGTSSLVPSVASALKEEVNMIN
ncbi:deoxyribose-phosphate aldolase [Macrosteles quadrilineatus]|uniref:deoxyribose-phosphate aldolase n=1 Tax=Macrosteles quadrilineatus TaxID=74068 RepID=UPI0023E30178|nr:deoxyribose-phosphate aldolase [Macrosteles quadrilineatus]